MIHYISIITSNTNRFLRVPYEYQYVYSLINQDPNGAVRVMNICLQRSARLLAPVPLALCPPELVYTESRNADTLRTL